MALDEELVVGIIAGLLWQAGHAKLDRPVAAGVGGADPHGSERVSAGHRDDANRPERAVRLVADQVAAAKGGSRERCREREPGSDASASLRERDHPAPRATG